MPAAWEVLMPETARRLGAAAACGAVAAAATLWPGHAAMDAVLAGAVGCAAAYAALLALAKAPGGRSVQDTRPRSGPLSLGAVDILSTLSSPAIMFDRRGIAVHVNDAARRAFAGLEAGIVLRQWFRDADFLDELEEVLAGRASAHASFAEKRPIERSFRVDISLVSPKGEYGLMVFADQTEAVKVDRIRSDFIANASHELRTPLTAVSGFLETLQGPARNDPAARERFVALMLDQTQRMARLIDDLLSLSRLETQSEPEHMEAVDVGLLVATLMSALVHLFEDAKVKVSCALKPGELIVNGNPDELTQVFQNLIENACRYGAAGGRIEIEAAVSAAGHPGVAVRDHGAGIPSEHIPRLTERFYRVNAHASRLQKGTGLGLAIVKHILTRHRARLVIASREGQGSTFTVFFESAREFRKASN
jgi:two-component system phosphate regulon sensor histidine kinase PhoR